MSGRWLAGRGRLQKLLELQDGLVRQAVDALPPRAPGRVNLYALAIAASGRQQLFSREAHLALQVIAQRFGAEYRGGVLLSNGAPDLTHAPLATRGNTIMALSGLGHHADPGEDVAFLYLASHGAPDASLETDLPDLEPLSAISAKSLHQALTQSGLKRRVIVISACFAGSWIPELADNDTILITAARYDRTSFGCDDTRPLTYFGEAFLQGPLAHGASLQEAFQAAAPPLRSGRRGSGCCPPIRRSSSAPICRRCGRRRATKAVPAWRGSQMPPKAFL